MTEGAKLLMVVTVKYSMPFTVVLFERAVILIVMRAEGAMLLTIENLKIEFIIVDEDKYKLPHSCDGTWCYASGSRDGGGFHDANGHCGEACHGIMIEMVPCCSWP